MDAHTQDMQVLVDKLEWTEGQVDMLKARLVDLDLAYDMELAEKDSRHQQAINNIKTENDVLVATLRREITQLRSGRA